MKKVGEWFLNHLKLVLAIITFGITFVIIGVVMINSYTSYQTYEKRFDANDLEVRSLSAAEPKRIEIEDDFKSTYKNKLEFAADQLNVTTTQDTYLKDGCIDLTEKGGTIAIARSLEEKSFVDIEFVISSQNEGKDADGETIYGVQDLLSNISFVINGQLMEDVIDLPNSGTGQEWHHLVMAGFALPVGAVNVTISAEASKAKLMPQFQSIILYSSAVLSAPEIAE